MPTKRKSPEVEIIDLTGDDDTVIDLTHETEEHIPNSEPPTNPIHESHPVRVTFQVIDNPRPPEAILQMFSQDDDGKRASKKKLRWLRISSYTMLLVTIVY